MFAVAVGDIGKRIKIARSAVGPGPLRPIDLARRLDVSQQRLYNWESGRSDPPNDIVLKAARVLGVTVDWLMGDPQDGPPPSAPMSVAERTTPFQLAPVPDAMLPIVSRAGAGHWVEPFQCEDFEPVPAHLVAQDCFGVVVDGDSMYPFLHPGDIAVFKAAKSARIGQTVLARNDEKALTVKVYRHNGEGFELVPINQAHPKATAKEWEIEGVLVAYVRDIGPRRITDSDPNGLRWDPATAPVV